MSSKEELTDIHSSTINDDDDVSSTNSYNFVNNLMFETIDCNGKRKKMFQRNFIERESGEIIACHLAVVDESGKETYSIPLPIFQPEE